MSLPPQPGPWGPGGMPPGPQPGYYGQPAWGPPLPPSKGNAVKWLLVVVALLLVIAITVGVTLFVTRDDDGGSTSTSTSATSGSDDVASANDTGPVAIITVEPTCQDYVPIINGLVKVELSGWSDRDNAAPASSWTPERRAQTESVVTAMRNAADQVELLAKQTPHRVVRELYEQFIAYGRAYADSIPTYTPVNDFLAGVNINAGSALSAICDAITFGSAVNRSRTTQTAEPPTSTVVEGLQGQPQYFVTTPDSTCSAWVQRENLFVADIDQWLKLNPNELPAQWTPEHRAIQENTMPIFASYASSVEAGGRQSGNSVLEDFAVLAALYYRAYITSIPTYVSADNDLFTAAMRTSNLMASACRATGG